jgi:hypothetical protein
MIKLLNYGTYNNERVGLGCGRFTSHESFGMIWPAGWHITAVIPLGLHKRYVIQLRKDVYPASNLPRVEIEA